MEETEKDLGESPSSFWPILLAFSLLLIAVGAVYTLIISVIGVLGLLACIAGWTLENRPPAEEIRHE
jgi:hypothetical protein